MNKQFRFHSGITVILTSLIITACTGNQLVTQDEYTAQLAHRPTFIEKSAIFELPGLPDIKIKSPKLDAPHISPIDIQIDFATSEDAQILVDSLKVMYGWLGLDITDRIKKHAQISPAGVTAKRIDLPEGEHNITIRIKDSKERVTEKDFTIRIAKHAQ